MDRFEYNNLMRMIEEERFKSQLKAPRISAVLSLFWPGAGQIYKGHLLKGFALFIFHAMALFAFFIRVKEGISQLMTAELFNLSIFALAYSIIWMMAIKDAFVLSLRQPISIDPERLQLEYNPQHSSWFFPYAKGIVLGIALFSCAFIYVGCSDTVPYGDSLAFVNNLAGESGFLCLSEIEKALGAEKTVEMAYGIISKIYQELGDEKRSAIYSKALQNCELFGVEEVDFPSAISHIYEKQNIAKTSGISNDILDLSRTQNADLEFFGTVHTFSQNNYDPTSEVIRYGNVSQLQKNKDDYEGQVTQLQKNKGDFEGQVTQLKKNKDDFDGQGTWQANNNDDLDKQISQLEKKIKELHENGDYQSAIEANKQLLSLIPDNIDALRNLSFLFLKQDNKEASSKYFQLLLEKRPNNSQFNFYYGKLLYEQGNFAQAKRCLSTSTMKEKHYYLGLCALELGDENEAYQHLVLANQYAPSAEILNNLGNISYNRGDFAMAALYYDRLSNLQPAAYEILCKMGLAWKAEGAHDKAKVAFDRALIYAPPTDSIALLAARELQSLSAGNNW